MKLIKALSNLAPLPVRVIKRLFAIFEDFIESNKFGKKELILHPSGDHYYLYIKTSNEEIRLNFKENIFDTELSET